MINSIRFFMPVKVLFISMAISLILLSCSDKSSELVSECPIPLAETVKTKATSSSLFVTPEEAELVALRFSWETDSVANNGKPRESEGIWPLTDVRGRTGAYAVGFCGGHGYAIISASRATSPVVAFKKSGCYSPLAPLPAVIEASVEMAVALSVASMSLPQDSVSAHAGEWKHYLPADATPCIDTPQLSSHGNVFIENVLWEWLNAGWEVYDASYWIRNQIHLTKLDGLEETLAKLTTPVTWAGDVPQNKLAYIVYRPFLTTVTGNSVIWDTNWDPEGIYSQSVPDGKKVSTQSVAVGQLLNYHKDSSISGYTASGNNTFATDSEIARFLYALDLEMGTVFGESHSQTTLQAMKQVLASRKYLSTESQFDAAGYMNSIDRGLPVILQATDKSGRSDAYVGTGYRQSIGEMRYALMVPSPSPFEATGPFFQARDWSACGWSENYFHYDQSIIMRQMTHKDQEKILEAEFNIASFIQFLQGIRKDREF